ncbi:MAG: ParB/RepB/Spo0J family partition protein [Oscillospiraceae bacterium]|nr:ParB/RepB/Spo0J family partition protein [Oscillospiraceae bacterium]
MFSRGERDRVLKVGVNRIIPNPAQPRKVFDPDGLKELSESIRQLGVLQPLTVRNAAGGYELVAGERRLRAARMAGLREVPCILVEADEQRSSLIALVENLQRRDLDCFEEAEGIRRLISLYGLSQEEAAARIGKSQSAVANKLRLLRLDEPTVELIRHYGLTERHARALLRLEKPEQRRQALEAIIVNGMNVAQTDAYVDGVLSPEQSAKAKKPAGRTLYIVKDVRVFLNTIGHAVDVMRSAGIQAAFDKSEDDAGIVLTIRIPKRGIKVRSAPY